MKNNRFKFRVWDTEKKELLYDAENVYDHMRPFTGEYIIEADCFGDLLEDERYIVEQCTGLKDKNGRLIYEGDIVFYSGVDLWRVIFKEKHCAFELERKDGYCVSMSLHKEMTLAGNVHENPGILDVHKGNKLKPCPFCGSTKVVDVNGWVQCVNCNASGPDSYDNMMAREAWNKRTEVNNASKN